MKGLAPTVLLTSLCASAHAQISNLACVAEGMQLVETVACVRVADFNGDGIQDVAILRNGSIDHVEVGLRDATGALPVVSPGAYPMILGSPPSRRGGTTNSTVEGLMAVGQLSGSPLPDVLVATQSGFLYLFENLGSPGVRAGWGGGLASSLGLFDEIHDLALSDVNGDGLLDIVVLWAPPSSTNQPNQVKILYNSAGGFSAANSGSIPLWVGTGQGVPSSIAMWDANRDGIPEAILGGIKDGSSSSYGTGWQINRNPVTGQTTFSALPWTIPLNADTPFHTVVADFDQDGWDDVAFGCFFSSTVRRTLHVQRLTFGSQLTPAGAVQSFFGDPIRCLVASDIDLDGDPDLLITTPRSLPASDLVGFVNTGGGAFSINLVNIPTNRSSVLLEMSDAIAITAAEISVVADGKPDVVIGNDIQAPSNRRAIRLLENQNLLPWSAYGTGCTGSNGRLTLGKVTNAVRGAPYTVRLSGLPTSGGLYAVSFGLSSVASATVGSLPASMSSLGAPGCFIYASPDVMYYRAGATSGTADVTNNVPANATLLGLIFYNQGYALDAGVNNLGVTSSNACAVRVL